MSERLTDEEMADVVARVMDGKCHNCEGTGNEQPWRTCRVCDGTGVFALSTETMQSVLAELRERRAADLSADDRLWLNIGRRMLRESTRGAWQTREYVEASVAAIDKVLSAGVAKERCDECDPSFGCFSEPAKCRKHPAGGHK